MYKQLYFGAIIGISLILPACWPRGKMERKPTKAIYLDEVIEPEEGITGKEKLQELIQQGFVVVEYYAEWCPPCRMISPIIDELADAYHPHVSFIKLDIDIFPELTTDVLIGDKNITVTGVPYTYFFKDGQLIHEIRGGYNKTLLHQAIDTLIAFPGKQLLETKNVIDQD